LNIFEECSFKRLKVIGIGTKINLEIIQRLKVLFITNCFIEDFDSKGHNLSKLTQLEISNCQLKRITLTDLPQLWDLSLKNNYITNINDIQINNCKELYNLDLSGNQIENISNFSILK
jgi:Leucine-rich repeat (LRR) protein